MMLVALLDHAQQRGVRSVFLEVRADNDAAIALYDSEGFQTIDRRVGYYQPDGVDALVMRKELSTPAREWAVGRE
jgi:ribosomal protein S18 acetylase RimI-like enzyme